MKLTLEQELALARNAHEHDLAVVAALRPDQADYLARLKDVPDPKSDGLSCFDHEGHGPDEGAH